MKKYAVKKAPKIITSEMMKSSIPSSGASTRDERCASGGPWCSSACAIAAASIASLRSCWLGVAVHDVLHGLARGAPHPLDQVGSQPARLGLGERRDDDVVHAEVLQRV